MMPSMSLYHLYKDVVDPQKTRTGGPANWNYKLLEKHKEHISWMEILQAGWGYIFSWKRLMYEWKWEKSYQKNSGGKSFFIFHNKCSFTVLFSWELTSFCTSNWYIQKPDCETSFFNRFAIIKGCSSLYSQEKMDPICLPVFLTKITLLLIRICLH